MHRLEFTHIYDYSGDDEGVVLPVLLRSGAKQVRVAASVDTGASFCMFGAEIAEALGLNPETGTRTRFRTANSRFEAFGHEVELSVLGIVTNAMVYFFADPTIDKNVLGRIGWLDRVRFGLVHHDSKVYIAPYDQG
jgi:predicted aspartyl protease